MCKLNLRLIINKYINEYHLIFHSFEQLKYAILKALKVVILKTVQSSDVNSKLKTKHTKNHGTGSFHLNFWLLHKTQ